MNCSPIEVQVTIEASQNSCSLTFPPSTEGVSVLNDFPSYVLGTAPSTQTVTFPTSDACGPLIFAGDPSQPWLGVTPDAN